MIEMELINFAYRNNKGTTSNHILHLFPNKSNNGQNFNRRITRNMNVPSIYTHTDTVYNNGFLCKLITLWLRQPQNIKTLTSVKHSVRIVCKLCLLTHLRYSSKNRPGPYVSLYCNFLHIP